MSLFKARSTVPEDPLGLTLVHGNSDPEADIIFVHGLGGFSLKTWSWNRDPANFWPTWIHHEEGLSRLRIFTFGYNANFRDSKATYSILDFSKSLLAYMQSYGSTQPDDMAIGLKPIVFICHSMGGLIVKKALVLGKTSDQYSSLLSQVHGIMFFSTPHRGSPHASTLNSLLSLLVGSSKKVYVSELDPYSTSIGDINEQFRGICESWELVSLYETKMTKLSPGIRRKIVDKTSGVLNYPREISVPLDADHHTICKFKTRLDPNYRLFIDLLGQVISRVRSSKAVVPRSSEISLSRQGSSSGKRAIRYTAVLEEILGITRDKAHGDLDTHLAQALPGSCQWLHQNNSFRAWLDSSDGEVSSLWLTGLPGTGKSTLAAMTIDHLQRPFGKSSCQYHFFDETKPLSRSTAYSLRAIAYQLANSHREFAETLMRLHQGTGFVATEQTFGAVWETIFEDIVFKMDFGHTLHWVFDGLDEAETPKVLVRSLVDIRSQNSIKIFLLSRPKRELTSPVTVKFGPTSLVHMSTEDTQADIQALIASVILEILPDDDQSIRQSIIERLCNRAEGSFLWTKLALETLRENWHTQAGIEMSLNLPNGMDSVYKQMMANVCNQGPRLQEMAFRILTWAAYAIRPLSIDELAVAMEPEYVGFVNLSETVVLVCGHFVRVHDGRMVFIHSTARSFLINMSGLPFDATGIPFIEEQEAGHATLAITCLQYLCQDHWRGTFSVLSEEEEQMEEHPVDDLDFPSFGLSLSFTSKDRLEPLYKRFPLLLYAMNNWAYHTSQAGTDNQALCLLIRNFCGNYMLQWIQAVALSSKLDLVTTAARQLGIWMANKRRQIRFIDSSPPGRNSLDDVNLVKEWMVDLVRIVAKFGPNLLKSPSSVYMNIPPLCPSGSIIARTYGRTTDETGVGPQLLSVSGLSSKTWDDHLTRLPVSEDEIASAIRCSGNYFLALISRNGTVIVWHRETCEEVYRLHHGEWTTLLSTDRAGRWAATAGRFTFQVWDLNTGQRLYKVPKTSPARTLSLNFATKSDTRLVLGYDDCMVTKYDLEASVEETLFIDPELADNPRRSCPRVISLSPDQKSVAIAFRGVPVAVWNFATVSQQVASNSVPKRKISPRICIRNADRDLELKGQDVFNAPEVVRWQPVDGTIIYILYQDTTIVAWDLVSDTQKERKDTGAREMVLNNDGSLLLTSDNSGAIHVWTLPGFNLIYQLNADEFVRDLTFSPDSQCIYDVRGSGCNVWAPDILMRLDSLDAEERSPSNNGSNGSDIMKNAVQISAQHTQRAHITALVADDEDEFFCVGRDDGAVNIHAMSDGQVVRKAYKHSATAEVTMIEWSLSRRFIASADDSSRVIAKRLRIKEDDKWAVFPMFDFRVGDAVTQLLFSQDETLLLVSTESTDRLWDLNAKKEICRRQWPGELQPDSKWLHCPADTAQLIWLSGSKFRVHTWSGLAHELKDIEGLTQKLEKTVLEPINPANDSKQEEKEEDVPDYSLSEGGRRNSPPPPSSNFTDPTSDPTNGIIKRVLQLKNKEYIVYECLMSVRHNGDSTMARSQPQLYLVHLSNLSNGPIYRKALKTLSSQIRHLLGPIRDKLVLIDQENWVCTTSAITAMDTHADANIGKSDTAIGVRRHFFLPSDWVNPMTLRLVTKKGTILTARNGEVAILRYGKGF